MVTTQRSSGVTATAEHEAVATASPAAGGTVKRIRFARHAGEGNDGPGKRWSVGQGAVRTQGKFHALRRNEEMSHDGRIRAVGDGFIFECDS